MMDLDDFKKGDKIRVERVIPEISKGAQGLFVETEDYIIVDIYEDRLFELKPMNVMKENVFRTKKELETYHITKLPEPKQSEDAKKPYSYVMNVYHDLEDIRNILITMRRQINSGERKNIGREDILAVVRDLDLIMARLYSNDEEQQNIAVSF